MPPSAPPAGRLLSGSEPQPAGVTRRSSGERLRVGGADRIKAAQTITGGLGRAAQRERRHLEQASSRGMRDGGKRTSQGEVVGDYKEAARCHDDGEFAWRRDELANRFIEIHGLDHA